MLSNNRKTQILAKDLLNQIIEQAEYEDWEGKKTALKQGKGEEAVGESWMVYHLKILKNLLNEQEEK